MDRFKRLTAAEVMHTPVVCAAPDEMLTDLERRLVDEDIGGVPVVEDGRLVGVVSRSDYLRVPLVLEALDGYIQERAKWVGPVNAIRDPSQVPDFHERLEHMRVKDAMTRQVVTCSTESPVCEVASGMVDNHIHRVVVVDAEEHPVGIISSLDLVRLLL